jgi:Zn-dependent peptidase ImmA (M78 family)
MVMTEQDKEQEREANLFAIALLMPARFIHQDMEGQSPLDLENDQRIKSMAKRYGVTEQMMTARLVNLGYLT